jgi:hypothetical protein
VSDVGGTTRRLVAAAVAVIGLGAAPPSTLATRAHSGLLVVCAAGAPGTFQLSVNGAAPVSVQAGRCSAPLAVPTGSATVTEVADPGSQLVDASAAPWRKLLGTDLAHRAVTVKVTQSSSLSEMTVATFTNGVAAPAQQGSIEICQEASDAFTAGSFHYTIQPASGPAIGRDVRVGSCSGTIQVGAGAATVTGSAAGTSRVSDIDVFPAGRAVDVSPAGRTAVVDVAASDDPSDETLLTFFDQQQTGQFKVCQTLAANAGALAGASFTYDVSAPGTAAGGPFTVAAGDAGTTTCRAYPTPLPIGAAVTVTERSVPNIRPGVSVSPTSRDAGSSGTTASFTLGPGVTTTSFSSLALGALEVCANAADLSTSGQPFRLSVNGGGPVAVRAGQCSPTLTVPAGTATVREVPPANFGLRFVAAGDGRLLSGGTANPASVSVPYGGAAGATVVTFTNGVDTGQFAVCAASVEPSLQATAFTLTWAYTVDGAAVTGGASLQPGACSSLSPDIPVVDAAGDPITVSVSEAPIATVALSDVSLSGSGALLSDDLTGGTAAFIVGRGPSILTFTNVRTPPQ